jgi:regulator of sirC expression with transglutaminase-like and TPR domain
LEKLEGIRKKFSKMADLPDEKIDLARAALLMARIEYPHLDESFYLDRLEDMAARLRSRVSNRSNPEISLKETNRLLFEEEGFRGNLLDYLDPRNSLLNQVLDRKLGIPISLSLVFMEVGRKAGLDVRGIGLPGHFITALYADTRKILIDPFNQGKILSEGECRQMVLKRYGESKPFETSFLNPVGPKYILGRMLRNLKAFYLHMNRDLMAFQMIEWILALNPEATTELRERALLYEAIGDGDRSVRDLVRYLELSPAAEDKETIRQTIEMLKKKSLRIH